MAGPGLPVNIDTTYADSGTDPSVKIHQQNHDTGHTYLDKFDSTILTGVNGQTLAYNVGGLIVPVNASSASPAGETLVVGTGSAAIQAAVTAAPAGGVVRIPAGTSHTMVSAVVFPNKDITVLAYGAIINNTQTAGTYAFTKGTNRNRLTWLGGSFIGTGSGINYTLPTSVYQSYDFVFRDVSFNFPSTETALYLGGLREGVIESCFFDNCTGIRLAETLNTHVTGCQFRTCTHGIYAGSTGSPFDAGLMVNNCTIIGCSYGVRVVGWEATHILNSMIDYNDHSVNLTNVNGVALIANYFSQRDYAGTASPAVYIGTNGATFGNNAQHIRFLANNVVTHSTASPQLATCLQLDGVTWCSVADNSLQYFSQYGINLTTTANTYVKITDNDFVNIAGGTTPASIKGSGSGYDDTWRISGNYLSIPTVGVLYATVFQNLP